MRVIVIVIVVIVVVTGGKESQLLALALGLGWSLTKTTKFYSPCGRCIPLRNLQCLIFFWGGGVKLVLDASLP